MRPEAVAALLPYLTERFGNPSGTHSIARAARRALDDARDQFAELVGSAPPDVIFTSGGTESDNLAVAGLARGPRSVVCSAVEHSAVLEACRAVGGTVVPVDHRGIIDLDRLADVLDGNVQLVSLMLVNNETGVIQPLATALEMVRHRAPSAFVHTDAVQAFSWLDVRTHAAGADLLTLSAHKFGGPKGVGVLVANGRARRELQPLFRGGPQEHERRAGTPNLAGIVAAAAAGAATDRDRTAATRHVGELAARLVGGIVASVPGVTELLPAPGDAEPELPPVGAAEPPPARVAAICNLGVDGVEAEELLLVLDELGIAASAGSSCASGALEPSHVLLAMGRSSAEARRHVRLSLGHTTTAAEVDAALMAFPKAVERLRR